MQVPRQVPVLLYQMMSPDKIYYFNRTVNSKDKGAYLNVETPGQIGANDFGNWKLITADPKLEI